MFYLLQTEPRYLAKCVYLIQPEEMDSFLETTILTLYGDAFSPREEFLILRLFQVNIMVPSFHSVTASPPPNKH